MQIAKMILGEDGYCKVKRSINNFKTSRKWLKTVFRDIRKNKNMPLFKKLWAYKHGFLSYRIPQFDLTGENTDRYISDLDYAKLFPVNNMFVRWIDDKLTVRYVLSPFRQYMPAYYFHLTKRSVTGVLKLMDCPDGFTADIDGVLNLLETNGVLAVKNISGSHGTGFYKLGYDGGTYYINEDASDKDNLKKLLGSMHDSIVTEYVMMHDELKKLNTRSVNTVRLMVFNEHGDDPVVGFAYLRIGTKKSGMVDNVSSGGLSSTIDINNGHFCGAISFTDSYKIVDHKVHPDTNILIDGFIPHWKTIIAAVKEICLYIGELEYMGFDIAVTPDGFKILEINSHIELPLFDFYNSDLRGYLSRLLKRKYIKSFNNF